MAAGYSGLLAFWLGGAGKVERTTGGYRIGTITKFYNRTAAITSQRP